MASTIGVSAMPNADIGVAVAHPESYFRGSTSGMGGASSEVHERYSAVPTHHFRLQPGSKMFAKHYKARVYGSEGTWGMAMYRKYNPVKQMGGSAGYLNQDPRSYIPARDMPARTLGRVVKSQFLPRGGSVPRVVGTGGGGDDEFYDDGSGIRVVTSFNNVDSKPINLDMADRRNAQIPGEPKPEGVSIPTQSTTTSSSSNSPPPLQIPTSAIIAGAAENRKVNAGLSSSSPSPMSISSAEIGALTRVDEAVAMEIDEFNHQVGATAAAAAAVPVITLEARVVALINRFRETMTENEGELPANVLVELGNIIDSMYEIYDDYQTGTITAQELYEHVQNLASSYRIAVQLAAGSPVSTSSSSGKLIQRLQNLASSYRIAVQLAAGSPVSTSSSSGKLIQNRRRSSTTSTSSKEGKVKKREGKNPAKGETFSEAKMRKYKRKR